MAYVRWDSDIRTITEDRVLINLQEFEANDLGYLHITKVSEAWLDGRRTDPHLISVIGDAVLAEAKARLPADGPPPRLNVERVLEMQVVAPCNGGECTLTFREYVDVDADEAALKAAYGRLRDTAHEQMPKAVDRIENPTPTQLRLREKSAKGELVASDLLEIAKEFPRSA